MGSTLKDKVAIVTGSGQGIGRAIALGLAAEGAKVITNNRKPGTSGGDAEDAAQEIISQGGQAFPVYGSVDSFEGAGKLIQAAVEKFGTLDILMNNAGTDAPHMVWNMTEEEWDRTLDSYLKGTFNTIRHASVIMREKRWGRIINTTSINAFGDVGHCNYCAAKAGIIGLTYAIARELGAYGVTCNAYAPAARTRFTYNERALAGWKQMYEKGLLTKEGYEGRVNMPGPEGIAPFIAYLCTDAAADINGQIFHVKGNRVAIYSVPEHKYFINKEQGLWTVEELAERAPKVLLQGYQNPAPPQPPKEKTG